MANVLTNKEKGDIFASTAANKCSHVQTCCRWQWVVKYFNIYVHFGIVEALKRLLKGEKKSDEHTRTSDLSFPSPYKAVRLWERCHILEPSNKTAFHECKYRQPWVFFPPSRLEQTWGSAVRCGVSSLTKQKFSRDFRKFGEGLIEIQGVGHPEEQSARSG